LVFIFVPQVSSDAPTSGFTRPYVVVVVSAIINSYVWPCGLVSFINVRERRSRR
jgi:hypothetical protein